MAVEAVHVVASEVIAFVVQTVGIVAVDVVALGVVSWVCIVILTERGIDAVITRPSQCPVRACVGFAADLADEGTAADSETAMKGLDLAGCSVALRIHCEDRRLYVAGDEGENLPGEVELVRRLVELHCLLVC